jgi:hypothetical protein
VDFAAIGYKSLQQVNLLIVDVLCAIRAELANTLTTPKTASA